MPETGTYLQRPKLVDGDLPGLVRRQRTYASKVEKAMLLIAPDLEKEKAEREKIKALLIADGFTKSQVVTCNGYDVRYNERAGQTSVNVEKLVAALVVAGLEETPARLLVRACEETGEPAKFATVTPSKGAKVRR